MKEFGPEELSEMRFALLELIWYLKRLEEAKST